MTKELEKEAMDYANKWLEEVKDLELYHNKTDPKPKYIRIKEAYLAGAEPREKQIQIDAEQIRALQKQNGELTDKVKELEAQIEKMKCDVLSLIKDRMNDDIDQNIIERLAEKWEIKEK